MSQPTNKGDKVMATKIGTGTYHYRGVEITAKHDSEDYRGWWQIRDLNDVNGLDYDYWPTKRAAMAAIDLDPPAGH
jgi:hypothetical protein